MRQPGIAVVVGILGAAATARADGDVPRYQVIAADVAADATLAVAVHLESPRALGVGTAAYLLVAPAIHLAHGDVADGARSVGLRLATPIAGAFVFGLAGLTGTTGKAALDAGIKGVIVGAAVGAVVSQACDAAFFAGPAATGAAPRVVAFGGQF